MFGEWVSHESCLPKLSRGQGGSPGIGLKLLRVCLMMMYHVSCILLISAVASQVPRTLEMCFQPGLLQHFLQQDMPVPSAAVICRSRIELDMASCIYAREHFMNPAKKWAIHVRCDSSPQGGRDFFVVEYDHCSMDCPKPFKANRPVFELLSEGRFAIANRILPLTVIGARAASSLHKTQRLLEVLAMESSNLTVSTNRVYSILCDFGAESGIWNMQALETDDDDESDGGMLYRSLKRLFPRALPIADCDHGLHHVTSLHWHCAFIAFSLLNQ